MSETIPEYNKIEGKEGLFVNPRGVLCKSLKFYTLRWTSIDVSPVFEGWSVDGRVLNENDWSWINTERVPEDHFPPPDRY